MRKFIRIVCWFVVVTAIAWTIIAIANGKYADEGLFAGVFLASRDDMMAALFAQIAAAVAVLILMTTNRKHVT